MNEKLVAKYRKYARTDEAHAVFFVRHHLPAAKNHWVDPEDFRRYERSSNTQHFRYVYGGLYKRKLHPKYPPKSAYTINGQFDEHNYELIVRAITWETAHTDIAQQKDARIRPLRFEITGVCYDRNKDNPNYFSDDAPPEIKALARNLNDRTNPLWDVAMDFVIEPDFVHEIRTARLI